MRHPLGLIATLSLLLGNLVPVLGLGYISEVCSSEDFIEVVIPASTADASLFLLYVYDKKGRVETSYSMGSPVKMVDGWNLYVINEESAGGAFEEISSNDAFALVNAQDEIEQFLSFKNSVTASEGPAVGQESTKVGKVRRCLYTEDEGREYVPSIVGTPGILSTSEYFTSGTRGFFSQVSYKRANFIEISFPRSLIPFDFSVIVFNKHGEINVEYGSLGKRHGTSEDGDFATYLLNDDRTTNWNSLKSKHAIALVSGDGLMHQILSFKKEVVVTEGAFIGLQATQIGESDNVFYTIDAGLVYDTKVYVPPPTSPDPVEVPPAQFALPSSCGFDDTSRYNICLDLVSTSISLEDAQAFTEAQARWESVLSGDVKSYTFSPTTLENYPYTCNQVPQKVDDIYVCGGDEPMDGSGGILAYAGPVYLRRVQEINPYNGKKYEMALTGVMKFDASDVAGLVNGNTFKEVIMHELGHILGLGSVWQTNSVHVKDSPAYSTVTNAQYEWEQLGCSGPLPVEQDGGAGTKNGHFDEACLSHELMTGFLSGAEQPLSSITIASLEDIGYTVNYNAADPFSIADLNLPGCGIHCPGPRSNRMLRVPRHLSPSAGRVSEEGRVAAHAFAAKKLRQNRQHEARHLAEGEDELIYVAGDLISIVYMSGSDIVEETVTWEQVQYLEGL